jgi:hypothetical protein
MVRETTMGGSGRGFGQTAWTVILKARDRKELGALVEMYWKPCYFYVRRKGHDVEDAKDLTQGFFSDFIGTTPWPRDQVQGQVRAPPGLPGPHINSTSPEGAQARQAPQPRFRRRRDPHPGEARPPEQTTAGSGRWG